MHSLHIDSYTAPFCSCFFLSNDGNMHTRTNGEVRDLPRYNEIHVDHKVFVTTSTSNSTISPKRPTYSITPIIYSPSESSHSAYSKSSYDHDTPATSIERSSDPVSEGTMTNLDVMLNSRNASLDTRHDEGEGVVDVLSDRMAHRELVDFLRTCEPPPDNFKSITESFNNANGKGSFKVFARRKVRGSKSARLLRLPDSAVAATTTHGHKHIAISIQEQNDHPGLVSQYQYYAQVREAEPQSRTPQKLQKSPPRVAGSARTSPRTVSNDSRAKAGTVPVRRPVIEPAASHSPNRNASVHVSVERGPRNMEPPTTTRSNALAANSRGSSNAPAAIGIDNAEILQKFWEQHPSPEERREPTGSNRNLPKTPTAQRSPGRQGSETTDLRNSEGTLGTATASGGHSQESSGANPSKQHSGAKIVMIGRHPSRTTSRARESNTMPITPRQFPLRNLRSTNSTARTTALEASSLEISPSRKVIPVETRNRDNGLTSPSGFVASPSYSSRKPPQPGPAPNRKLPDLPEGSGISRNGSSSSANKTQPHSKSTTLPPQATRSISKLSSSVDFEKASTSKEADYTNHPANRTASNTVREETRTLATARATRQMRHDRVRAKKQRDIAHLKALSAANAQTGELEGPNILDGEALQQESLNVLSNTAPENGTAKGSVRNARKRSEALLPIPLDCSKIPSFGSSSSANAGDGDVLQVPRSLPVADHNTGTSLPPNSHGGGGGGIQHVRKESEVSINSLEKVEASATNSSGLQNLGLRAAANALTSVMQDSETKPQDLTNISHLPPLIPSQGGSKLINVFPFPPRSIKRQTPHGLAASSLIQGVSAHSTQAPPRSPSPSLPSSDEEGNLNDGRGKGVAISIKSPPRSQERPSTKSTIHTAKTKQGFVAIPIIPLQAPQRKSSNSRSHSRPNTINPITQAAQDTDPSSLHRSDSINTNQALDHSENLRAAISAFELHRTSRRQERNRILRDRRAREIAYDKERAAQDEAVARRLAKSDEKHEAIEDRLKGIEDRNVDLVRKYELMIKIAEDIDDMKSIVKRMNDRVGTSDNAAAVYSQQASLPPSARGLGLMSPVIGKMGTKGMRIDISMPPSSCGDPTPASLTTPSGLGIGRRLPFMESDIDVHGDAEAEAKHDIEEACPQYEGNGQSNFLGGGTSGRSSTPIGSLIEELQSSSKAAERCGGMHHYVRLKRNDRGPRSGDLADLGPYNRSGWSREDSGVALNLDKVVGGD